MKSSPDKNKNKQSESNLQILFCDLVVLLTYLFFSCIWENTHILPHSQPFYQVIILIQFCRKKRDFKNLLNFIRTLSPKNNLSQLFARHCFKCFTYINSLDFHTHKNC